MAYKDWLRQSSLYARFLWISVPMALIIVGILIVVGVDPMLVMIGLITYWIITSVIVYLME